MRIQLWSYNYDPEPTGIAPLSAVWARTMANREHDVLVVAAHPHYPEPLWGARLKPYRERRGGVRVLRLPLWVGRNTLKERIRQELTYAAALGLVLPLLPTPDAIVAVSPSFPALGPAILNARARRTPWVLWLQDVLPDGAVATGILDEETAVVRASRAFERAAYAAADRIVVISDSFAENLHEKGVANAKLARIYNPASRSILQSPRPSDRIEPGRVLTMGNIGYTQNLVEVTRAFEDSRELEELGASFVMAGDGVIGDAVRAAIRTDRARVTGILGAEALEEELAAAAIAVVSQRYEGVDFNVPSKLMNFMGYGIPVVASVRLDSEIARIVRSSGCGWVTDSADPHDCAAQLAEALRRPDELRRRAEAGLRFARRHFSPNRVADDFEDLLASVTSR